MFPLSSPSWFRKVPISKTGELTLPQIKKWVEMSPVLGATFYKRSGWEEGKNTKPIKELSFGAEFNESITWKNFTTFSKFFDLHCSLT